MSSPNKRALIVDDDQDSRLVLKLLLEKSGFDVIQALNGLEAIERVVEEPPQIIFMDVEMPVMNGLDAAKKIKAMHSGEFIPLIFLTAHNDDATLNRCIEAGGDDFLTKPVSPTLLNSKIQAMGRIQELLKQTAQLKDQMQNEEEVAEQIFRGAISAPNDLPKHLHRILQPAGLFSGDMILASFTPGHELDILVGDFTGHGLTAAIGALPASEIFHAMSKKGFSPAQILETINNKLKRLLPTGIFMAAQFVRINHDMHIEVCNCGMPDILVLDGHARIVKHRIGSNSLPLGITGQLPLQGAIQYLPLQNGDRVVLFSDGVIEARSKNGVEFGQTRLERALEVSCAHDYSIAYAFECLKRHCNLAKQDDDISLVEVICTPDLLIDHGLTRHNKQASDSGPKDNGLKNEQISLSLTYKGERLRNADPAPSIVNFINSNGSVERHKQELYMIITELFVNALDHGVLGLDSKIKATAEGFGHYFIEREKRLAQLDDGYVNIYMQTRHKQGGGSIIIRIEDSGAGFDHQSTEEIMDDLAIPSGRGIRLVKELCESLRYDAPGNVAEAVYSWRDQ